MRLEADLYRWGDRSKPEGTIIWDSETGEIGGSLADEIGAEAAQARGRGEVPAGPQFSYIYPTPDPLHHPDQLAAVLLWMGFFLPDELLAQYHPDFPHTERAGVIY
jgi:hypothetical protein